MAHVVLCWALTPSHLHAYVTLVDIVPASSKKDPQTNKFSVARPAAHIGIAPSNTYSTCLPSRYSGGHVRSLVGWGWVVWKEKRSRSQAQVEECVFSVTAKKVFLSSFSVSSL